MKNMRFSFHRHIAIVLQNEIAECGLACLAMILNFHGQDIRLSVLRHQNPVSQKGLTLRSLIDIASQFELSARAVRLELQDLRRLKLPCILHWNLNHFVVLERVGPNGIVILDPAVGRRSLSVIETSRAFTGVALELLPTTLFRPKRGSSNLRFSDLFKTLRGRDSFVTLTILLSLGIEIISVLIPIGSQVVIDEVIINADRDLMIVVGVGLSIFLLAQFALGIFRSLNLMILGAHLNLQWCEAFFTHLTKLPAEFFEKRHVGDVVSRFGSLTIIQKAITTDLVQTLLDGLMSVGMIVMMLIYGAWLSAIVCVSTVITILIRVLAYRSYREATAETAVAEARQQSFLIETVKGIASIKILSLGKQRVALWSSNLTKLINCRIRTQRIEFIFGRTNEFLFGVDRVVLLMVGAHEVITQQMTLGMLVAFLTYRDQFAHRVGNLITSSFQLRMLDVQTERLSDIVLTSTEESGGDITSTGALHAKKEAGSLTISELSIRYSEHEPWIFHKIALDVSAGSCLTITGLSGCGKTTLLKALMGLMQCSEGSILFDGNDIRTIGLERYRASISGVLQDDGLFAGSIAENISSFDETPDHDWIIECAAKASILDDIEKMPMGLNTFVGHMGSSLSGGQKQRIMLARALYRRPKILFLDEATSHLDQITEAKIAEMLRDLSMTRIMISHRPSVIANSDSVIVIENGEVFCAPCQQANFSEATAH